MDPMGGSTDAISTASSSSLRDYSCAELEAWISYLVAVPQDGWEPVLEVDGRTVGYRRPSSDSSTLLKLEFFFDMALEKAINLWRPEACLNSEVPYNSKFFSKVGILRSYAPGDALGYVVPHRWVGEWMKLSEAGVFTTKARRLCFRSDLPAPGQYLLASGEVIFTDFGAVLSSSSVLGMILEHGPNGTTKLSEVMSTASMSTEAVQPLMHKFWHENPMAVPYLMKRDGLSTVCYWDLLDHKRLEEEYSFIILSMRKCCRGPPLLGTPPPGMPRPFDSGEDPDEWLNAMTWTPPPEDKKCFRLFEYLQHLMALAGEDPTSISDRLDGRALIFYQAVIPRKVWKRVSEKLHLLIRRQQKAYRRLHGGSGAPYLQVVDSGARYVGDTCPIPEISPFELHSLQQRIEFQDQEDQNSFCVKNTFLHFDATSL